jgi:iron complex outermembrane receptor protein
MKTTLLRGTALLALAIPVTVHAQSTGSREFEDTPIVVTGMLNTSISGFEIPETPKARQVLDAEAIRAQRPGQTINDIINLIPGVSFQNNDPWGSSGGRFTIRGFTSDRISQTLDGLPLNDSGNYALYTNQQVDPEILESVSVNLGVTDVDSPTASAVGGTINLRTRVPSDDFGILVSGSYGNILAEGSGDRPYYRIFGMVDSGDITGIGTSAFFSASYVHYDNPFNNYGVVDKQQYNARIYQRIGGNGDFVSVAGHYNQNRNNFFGSFSLTAFPQTREDRFYNINFPCTVDAPTAGVADIDNNCGAEFDRRFNPSNTGNIRGASRLTLAEGLILTVDPSYQYVKANGGGDEELLEQTFDINGTPYTGFIRGGYYFGRDLNGDGDVLDEVTGHDPSQTQTHRFGVISSLAYDINDWHRLRLAYTWDRARHRQTGATSVALPDGEIADVFPINDPLVTADGFVLNKRDRLSYAILHQVSAEYRGRFFDEALTVSLGLRAPFFTRRLNQYCYTTSAGGFLDCIGTQDPTAYEAANPNAATPQSRTYNYDRLLPNVGFVYDVSDVASIFFNYAQGLSVPGTDPLYNSLFFADPDVARPAPETADSFDLGMRFQGPTFQGQIAAWYTRYENRLASAYDPILDTTVYRNLGVVDKYGIDGSIAWHPTPNTLLYLFGSYTESEIQDDIQNGVGTFLDTAGRRESGSPLLTYGARGEIRLGNLQIGLQAKHTGERYINDENLPIAGYPSATVGGYTLVDFDLRYDIMELPTGGTMSVQLNLTNLFDELYVGSFGGSLSASSAPFVQIGPPRAGSISLIVGF